jgi:ATP-dependent Clp protease, protease subunit
MQNRLIQLLADNRRPYQPMAQRIVQAAGSSEATVYLYDPIVGDRVTAEWWGGVCPQDFVPALRAIDAEVVHLRVNSPGGDVFGAEAMCQALRDHPGRVVAHIEGLAASATTIVTCACDEVLITPNSKFMIHESWTLGLGNKRDMRALADVLEKCDITMLAEYARFTGNDLAQLTQWVEAETWFTGNEAVQHGFASGLQPSAQAAAGTAPRAAWKLRAYHHAPSDLQAPAAPEPAPPTPPAPPTEPTATRADGAPVDPDHRARLSQRTRLAGLLQPVE